LARYNDPSASGTNNTLGPALKFASADVVFDNNSNFATTGEKMFFLNLDYLQLCVHRSANWTQAEDKVPVNQDAVLIPVLFRGQLTCSNRARQGVLIDAA
jgi:hypothetical protein